MPQQIDFNMVITVEGLTYARQASVKPGWYIIPKRFAVTAASGPLEETRVSSSMFDTWCTYPFSGIYPSSTNKLLNSVVIPPNAYPIQIAVGEIYFIYETPTGEEFLYAIAQPTTPLPFVPGIAQDYVFAFTLNNADVADIYEIEYTFPQDAHASLLGQFLKKDGSRQATGILSYNNSFNFNNPRNIPDLGYIMDYVQEYVGEATEPFMKSLPTGMMLMWPKPTPPSGWLVRDGARYLISDYPTLGALLGNTYGSAPSGYFYVPDDRGLFERGWNNTNTGVDPNRKFGEVQLDGIPNITGAIRGGSAVVNNDQVINDGAFRLRTDLIGTGNIGGSNWQGKGIDFNASRSSVCYGRSSEVRPRNRAYLPIIKY